MLDIIKFWLKLFLYYASIFSITFYFIFIYVPRKYPAPGWVGSLAGIILAIFLAITQTRKQIGTSGLIPLKAGEEIVLNNHLKTIFDKIIQTLNELGFKIKDKDTQLQFIFASNGPDKITILLAEKQGKTVANVISEPKFFFVLADGGRNSSNVEKIISSLKYD